MAEGEDLVWLYGSQTRTGDPDAPSGIRAEGEIDEATHKSLNDAQSLLRWNSEASELATVDEAIEAYLVTVADMVPEASKQTDLPEKQRRLGSSLDRVLTALRGFDDRTKHELSRRYGEESTPYKRFDLALRTEFDNCFAYRFCWKLRNFSQHCGSAISTVEISAAELPGGGRIDIFRPLFQADVLLDKYDSWGEHVKLDLEALRGHPFSVEDVLIKLRGSVHRAFGKLLLSQRPQLLDAIDTVREVAKRQPDPDGYPLLVALDRNADDKLRKLTFSRVRIEVADLVERNMESAAATFGYPQIRLEQTGLVTGIDADADGEPPEDQRG